MSNDRINELPICAKLNELSSAIRAEFDAATLGGLSVGALDCAAPMAEAAALIGELVGLIRKHITFAERKFPQSVADEAEAALAKARAQ
jgi:hypothetical protein